jgi:hypothetical protein
MKDLLVKLVKNRVNVDKALALIDSRALENGRLLVTPALAAEICAVASDGQIKVRNGTMTPDGRMQLDVAMAGMELRYTLKVLSAAAAGGTLSFKAEYAEQRLSGGLGGALLGLSGRTALSVALGKVDGLRVTQSSVEGKRSGLPAGLSARYLKTLPEGLLFLVD